MPKKIDVAPEETKPDMTLAHVRDQFDWVYVTPDAPLPFNDPHNLYLLYVQGKGGVRLAPSLYQFMGWGWATADDRSDETIAHETVVAYAALPLFVPDA